MAFDFLKRLFPKKGDAMDDLDLDDELYATESKDPVDENEPQQSTKYKLGGLLIDFFRKFKPKSSQEDSNQVPVFLSDNDAEETQEEETPKKEDSHSGLLGKINNLEGAPKFVFLGVVTIFLVSSIYGGVYFFRNGKQSENAKRPSHVQQSKDPQKEASAGPALTSLPNTSVMENPFVEVNAEIISIPASAKQMDVPSSTTTIPLIGMGSTPSSMPAIPSTPRPSVPTKTMKIPLTPTPSTSSAEEEPAAPVDKNSIQGVITSSNPSENVAIMGDGRVVSVGETFNDGRIAYIGGDGITFDNGTRLDFRQ